MPSVLIALIALLALALAPSARAATVSVTDERRAPDRLGDPSYSLVFLEAGPGEANDVTLAVRDGEVVVRDAGTPLTAGSGCRAEGRDAICRGAFPYARMTVRLGDGDDRFSGDPTGAAYASLRVEAGSGADLVTLVAGTGELDGGPGADVLVTTSRETTALRGGEGADVLRGGPGLNQLEGDPPAGPFAADRLEGGAGGGTAVYTGRGAPVAVDLADPGPDGSAGEGDVLTGVESVAGGRGPDVLSGDGTSNALDGAEGGDRIDGRGGSDKVVGGEGRDDVAGGPGDDVVEAGFDDGLIAAGPGDDKVTFWGGSDLLGRPPAPRPPRVDCAGGDDDVLGLPPGTTVDRGCERLSVEALIAAVGPLRPGRRTLRVRLATDDNYQPHCMVRVQLRAAGRGGARTSARVRLDRGGAARARIPLPPDLRRALRRPGARLAVRLGGRYDCLSRGWRPEGHWRVAL